MRSGTTVGVNARSNGRQGAQILGVLHPVFVAVDVLLLRVAAKGVNGSEIKGVRAPVLIVLDAVVVAVELVQGAANRIHGSSSIGVRALVIVVTHAVAVDVVEQGASSTGPARKGGRALGDTRNEVALVTVNAPNVVAETVAVAVGGLRGLQREGVVLVGSAVAVGIGTSVQWNLDVVPFRVLTKAGGRIPERVQAPVQIEASAAVEFIVEGRPFVRNTVAVIVHGGKDEGREVVGIGGALA